MEKRTAEIIMVCKGNHDFGEFPTLREAVAAYLADRSCLSAADLEAQDGHAVELCVLDAAADFVDSTPGGSASTLLRDAYRNLATYNNSKFLPSIDLCEAVCLSLMCVDVCNADGFVNGFTEENSEFVRKGN